MPEVSRRVRIGKVLTFSIDGRIFGMLKNRLGMISSRNIKGMSFRRWLAAIPSVSCLSIMDSAALSQIISPFFANFLGIVDDFSKCRSAKIWQKMKKIFVQFALNPFLG